MTDRPAVLSAKLEKVAQFVADGNDLKGMAKSNRPNEASLDAVRDAHRDAMTDLLGPAGSVAEVEQVETPTERLK